MDPFQRELDSTRFNFEHRVTEDSKMIKHLQSSMQQHSEQNNVTKCLN